MSVLTKLELTSYMCQPDVSKRLVVTPLLDRKQIGPASLDLRLGNEFITIRSTHIPAIDPTKKAEMAGKLGQYQERIRIGFGESFILHPGQFVLGCTFEYLGMPEGLTAQVAGRSSWGRLGLLIETAPNIYPGFRGAITLELINAGLAPLVLYPGIIIAQLVVQKTLSDVAYEGRYRYPVGPEFSRVHEDKEMVFLGDPANFR